MLLKRLLALVVLATLLVIGLSPAQAAGFHWNEYTCAARDRAVTVALYRDATTSRVLVWIPAPFKVLLPDVWAGVRAQAIAQVNPTTYRQGYLATADCTLSEEYESLPPSIANARLISWGGDAEGMFYQDAEPPVVEATVGSQYAYFVLFGVLLVVLVTALVISQYIATQNVKDGVPSDLVGGLLATCIQLGLQVGDKIAAGTPKTDIDDRVMAILHQLLGGKTPPPTSPPPNNGATTE